MARSDFESWEATVPVYAQIAAVLRSSSKPPRELLLEVPELLDYFATKAAWLTAESGDEACQIAAKLAERLRTEWNKPREERPGARAEQK